MENDYSVIQIEAAINFWREREAPKEAYGLTARVRVLADVYGRMIHDRHAVVTKASLNDAQRDAVLVALNHTGALPED
ncbi:DUF3717 domain-containing protein [Massilia sp. DWR3-1-1]|uniref:DUF3717 domain-containing protein n=1 Tax=Massilia sp. DWR3-1-1 TaxID=2804559 RepID=UPI003CEB2C82